MLHPVLLAQQTVPTTSGSPRPETSPPGTLENLHEAFIGNWTGELEYRDYQSDQQHVKLPTWLDVAPAPDGRDVQFRDVYDDGPNKVVEEVSLITLDPQLALFTLSSEREKSKEIYQMSDFDNLSATGTGTLQLTGEGTENERKVDVHITIKIGRNSYGYQKETLPGADFQFCDGYNFTPRELLNRRGEDSSASFSNRGQGCRLVVEACPCHCP